ncbi:MAG: gliding motility-associated C-terminal domain-containing protein [Flavobacteriales bacterium]|nr:gliding motility-associated C-terminal domain-containing protein [Flavobacteriales bacterium]
MLALLFVSLFFAAEFSYAGNYYWVGGSGNWNDATHWSFISGGVGGAGIPQQHDNVYFDSKSRGTSKKIDIFLSSDAYCKTFTSTPSTFTAFKGKNNTVTIYGSAEINGFSSFEEINEFQFISNQNDNFLKFKTASLPYKISINGGGIWNLNEHLTSSNTILSVQNGQFISENYNIVCKSINVEKAGDLKVEKASILSQNASSLKGKNIKLKNVRVQTVSFSNLINQKENEEQPETIFSITIPNDTVSCGNNCDGTLTATINHNCINGVTIDWLPGTPNGDGTPTIFNLCPGTYTIVVTDNCSGQVMAQNGQVFGHPQIVPLIQTITQPKCNGGCDGSLFVFASGATPFLTYNWSTGFIDYSNGGSTISNLCAGTYTLSISDSIGCDTTITLVVNQPAPVSPNAVGSMVTCVGSCDGTATANPSGGTPPYVSYLWNPGGQTTQTATNLCPGNYTVTVTDANGCTGQQTVQVTEPAPIAFQLTTTNVVCNGACNGTGTVSNITGGIPPYIVTWNPGGQTGNNINNLCPGNYSVTVMDGNGCTTTQSFTISEPAAIIVTLSSTNVICFGDCNGTASVINVSGGSGVYVSYSWSPSGQNGPNATGLCPGTHTVTVTDNKGCTGSASIVITEPPLLEVIASGIQPSCNGSCDGSATVVINGGIPGYNISWNPGGQTTPSITNLCAGTYIVTVTDQSGCVRKDTVVLIDPLPINPNVQVTNVLCNGACNGSAISLTTGGTPPYSYNWVPGGQTTPGINGLCPGSYTVTVTDDNGCTGQQTIIITQPQALTATTNAIAASCGSICNGIASVTPAGGTPGYTYLWMPGGQTTQVATNLCAGVYTVTVTDANGCTYSTTVTITNLIQINIVTTAASVSCNGICDGTATATPSGGTPPYTYLWMPGGQTTQTAVNLCPGIYTVTATDANGCATTVQVTVPAGPSALTTNLTYTDVTCFGYCNGTASSFPSGGTPPYSLLWSPGGQTTNTINGLCAGTYSISVTDANNCTEIDSFVIIEPTPIAINPIVANPTCNGACDGSITLNPSGGTPGYTVSWNTGSTSMTLSNLCAGTYVATITDANGCQTAQSFTLIAPPAVVANIITTNASCNGLCDGTATAMAGGGTPPYTYFWSPGGQTSQTITNLCAGNYSVLITDQNGCNTQINFTITAPSPISANLSSTDVTCKDYCNGTATASPTGGTAPYTYLWAPGGQTTQTISGLCPGVYTVTITDASGCNTTAQVTITEPNVLDAVLSSTNINCNGTCTGTATAIPSGGTPPYTYLWVPGGQTTQTATGLCSGVYSVTILDANGCFFQNSVVVSENQAIADNPSFVNPNCGVCNGVISLAPTGGLPPYTYAWLPGGQTTASIGSLCAGIYSVTITDANGCSQSFTYGLSNNNGPVGASVILNNASCNGSCDGSASVIPIGGTPPYTYLWDDPGATTTSTANNLCAGLYNVIITDANGCVYIQQITIGETNPILATINSIDALCSGTCSGEAMAVPSGGTSPYTYLWSNGGTNTSTSGLCAGNHSVTITDDNGCSNTFNFTINEPSVILLNTSSSTINCNGNCDGTATVTASGGTSPYTFLWNNGQVTPTATNLCAGNYTVVVTDANGCTTIATISVIENPILQATYSSTNAICGVCDGTASVNPSGGTAPYTYLWNFGATTQSVVALCAGTYTVIVTDALGCSITLTIPVSNVNGPIVSISSVNATCNGGCDGTASATVSGLNPPFSYLWFPGGQTTSSVAGLCAGAYTVQVTDNAGCITVQSVTITDNPSLSINTTTNNTSCNGGCDGSAIAMPSGGSPPYTYLWSNGSTLNAVAGLCAGNYTVTVTDAKGCSFQTNVTIGEPLSITLTPSFISATCNGGCDGSATVNVSGGTLPYTYLWNNGATTQTIVNLCAGNYTVSVTDAKGCSSTANVTIGEGNIINITPSTTNATCGQCDGTASATVNGGSGPPYTYLWIPGGQTTPSVTNMCPGAYTLIITDNAGCSDFKNILIQQTNGPNINASSSNTSCPDACDGTATVTINSGNPPYSVIWNDPLFQTTNTATGLCSGLYNVVVQDVNGCISVDSITVNDPPTLLANLAPANPLCDGVCNGSITANPSGGNGGPFQYSWSPGGQTSQTISGLCAGKYVVTITDINGCTAKDSVTLVAPSPISVTINSTNANCNGSCDGTAFANPSGGNPPYTYLWSNGQTTQLAVGLCAGNYTVTLTDANGCTETQNVTINNPSALTATSSSTNAVCDGVCDGSATANPAGGTPPYSYIWSNGQTTQTATNLCPGNYTVDVSDSKGCVVTLNVSISAPQPLSSNTNVSPATCGLCDGTATANPSGGSGNYSYLWGNGQTTQTATNLCAGIITLQVTDNITGCIANFNVIINSIGGPTINLTTIDETCSGLCNGSASVNPVGGNPPYSYLWNNGQTTQTATGLCAGNYTVTVTDNLGCITIEAFTINTFVLDIIISNSNDPLCNGDCNGTATVTPLNGTPAYSYNWTPGGQITPTANTLCAGNYTVTVTDQTGCSNTTSVSLNEPIELAAIATTLLEPACNGFCDGAAEIIASGGTAPYSYLWSNGQTSSIATNLCAGTYSVIVTDANGCTASASVTVNEPTQIQANAVSVFPLCGVCDGQINLNPSGGTGPYTFLWNGGQVTQMINNLCAGIYVVTITDAKGCSETFTIPLSNTNGPQISLNSTQISCFGMCDGSAQVTVLNGNAPFSYLWNPTLNTTPSISNLCAGVYSILVTDKDGCVSADTVTIIEPSPIDVNVSSTPVTCTGDCDGTATANVSGGTGPYTYLWNDPSTQITQTAVGLCAGNYTVIVTDSKGCTGTANITISSSNNLNIDSITAIPASCNANCDGIGSVFVSGGIPPYQYSWNNGATSASTNTLCIGLATVTVTDAAGCTVQASINIISLVTVLADAGNDTSYCSGNGPIILNGNVTNANSFEWFELPSMNSLGNNLLITVNPPIGTSCFVLVAYNGNCIYSDTVCITVHPLPVVDAGADVKIVQGKSTILTATGGGSGASYNWSPPNWLSNTTGSSTVATPPTSTLYFVTVVDANGCEGKDSVLVEVLPPIKFPDGITPNGDGKNDYWIIDFIDQYPNNVVEIYNRWGQLLFRAQPYKNDWDGTFEGKPLPVGTYYFVIELNEEGAKPFTGPITIMR